MGYQSEDAMADTHAPPDDFATATFGMS